MFSDVFCQIEDILINFVVSFNSCGSEYGYAKIFMVQFFGISVVLWFCFWHCLKINRFYSLYSTRIWRKLGGDLWTTIIGSCPVLFKRNVVNFRLNLILLCA